MKILIKVSLFVLFVSIPLKADNRIVFSLQDPPPQVVKSLKNDINKGKISDKFSKMSKKTPGQMSRKLIKYEMKNYLTPKLGGFMAFYAGYVDYSSDNGLIAFPLRHTDPKLYLVITPKIKLIKTRGQTISRLEFENQKRIPTQIYLFEKKVDENKQFFWKVSEQDIPKDNIINSMSVVLLTKPKNIYIAKGDFISNDSKHIVLPENIYAVGVIGNNKVLLNSISIKRYFEPIRYKEEAVSDLISKKTMINS